MTDDLIRKLEALLQQPIPHHYLHAIEEYPSSLRDARRAVDDSDAEGFVCQVEFLNNLKDVLFLNVEARSDSVVDPAGFEILWPEQFLVIGESGGGDYYCIDAAEEIAGVVQFDHQAVQFEVVADSIDEFVDVLEETFCSTTED